MADFKLSRFRYTWQGEWAPATRYNPDDIVSYGGKSFTCLTTHVSNFDFYADLEFYNNDIPPLLVPRWELVADGVSWLGDWETDTYYKVGDLVKFGGTTYLCVEGHTSSAPDPENPTSATLDSYFSADADKWTIQITSKNWAEDWAPSTYYKLNDVVRYGGIAYRCNSSHLSAGSFESGLENSQSFWDVVNDSLDWQGTWTINTRYKVNDVVKYGGVTYKCTVGHKAAGSDTLGLNADYGKWSILHNGYEYVGTWEDSVTYKLNDVVKYGSYLYYCTTFHLSATNFDISNWSIFCPGAEYDVNWSSTTNYQQGDIVRYGGNLYVALSSSVVGQNPSTQTTAWQLLFQSTRIAGTWDAFIQYKIGDVVRRGGNLYLAFSDSIGQDPDILNDGSSTNSAYWDLVIPGSRWVGVWTPNIFYRAGDTVVWVSSSYRCLDNHESDQTNRPDDDAEDGSTLHGRYWEKITDGNKNNRLKNLGDIRMFGPTEDGSTVGYTRLPVGEQGQVLQVENGLPTWKNMFESNKVYYVAPHGSDDASSGTSPQKPWKTLRYATENVTGYATIFARTGVFEEILPIRIPAFVAIVGDELRGTIIKPAENIFSNDYISRILDAVDYIGIIASLIVKEDVIGDTDEESPAFGTRVYGHLPQDFSGSPGGDDEVLAITSLVTQFKNRVESYNPVTFSGTNTLTAISARLNAYNQLVNNKEFIISETTSYIEANFVDSTLAELPARWTQDVTRIVEALIHDIGYPGNFYTINAANFFINGNNAEMNKTSNMFLLQDGTGLRNATLIGLEGTLGEINEYGTRRPSAGAYASLDPGWGPTDTSVWVGTKSPFVVNCTTFGTGCVGFKIDGDLHAGGNQTMVANDFTQILSDGIGVWANGEGRTECVSIFTYYCHIGYLCTNGGKIRGTNGNCSYGTYGAVSEKYNTTEDPITCTVNNRYYDADVYQTMVNDDQGLMKVFYSHAGNGYSSASYSIVGSGINAQVSGNEIRDGGVYEVRITNRGDSSAEGGSGYVFTTNAGQGTTDAYTFVIAGSDENDAATYKTMRILIPSGQGVGQYGYIADYDATGKVVYVAKESTSPISCSATSSSGNWITLLDTTTLSVNQPVVFSGTTIGNIANYVVYFVHTIDSLNNKIKVSTSSGGSVYGLINATGSFLLHAAGWEHLVEGTPIQTSLNTTANYAIEPRITFTSPGFTSASTTLPNSRQWSSLAFNGTYWVAVAIDSNVAAYSADGVTWTNGTLPVTALWTKIKYTGGVLLAFATGGYVAKSTNGTSWSSVTIPGSTDWRDVSYGNSTWVAISGSKNIVATSLDLTTWTTSSLPEGADWNAIEYGSGKFVIVAASDSSTAGAAVAYSTNGTAWTATSIPQGAISLAFGNNRWVALSGGYAGATEVSISFNGSTWYESTLTAANWQQVTYGQGLFVAVATGTNTIAISKDGYNWTYQSISTTAPWAAVCFGNPMKPGKFLAIAGFSTNSNVGRLISTGVQAQARARVVAGRISSINIWEPGSGYTSAPAMTITDPSNSSDVSTAVRIGNGVLGNPTIINAGTGYETSSTVLTVSGDGYKDQYQIGDSLVVNNLTRIPGPGDNLNIAGIDDYTYKLLTATILSGSIGNYTARLTIAKDLGREESPEHGTSVEIRQQYSQVRLTGHDFLDIGLGGFYSTNYPDTLNPNGTVLAPEDEVRERDGGRVFYTSTDQDGNFRVGELFSVEQATGTVTLNAQFFELQGLEELRLGGVTVGGSGVVVREFSTDITFTADSNNVVPTQRAIKAYIQRRVSGGGADAVTAQLVAGIVQVGPQALGTTTGDELIFTSKVNFKRGIDGTMLVASKFLSGT